MTIEKHSNMAEAIALVDQLMELGATGRDAVRAAVLAFEVDEEQLLMEIDHAYYGA